MNDKTLLIAEAMGYIDDKFLEEAHSEAKGIPHAQIDRQKNKRRIAAVACLCLIALGVSRLPFLFTKDQAENMASGENAPVEEGIPPSNDGMGHTESNENQYPSEEESVTAANSQAET